MVMLINIDYITGTKGVIIKKGFRWYIQIPICVHFVSLRIGWVKKLSYLSLQSPAEWLTWNII